ncbi:hypothetical protein ACJ73_01337 [Blastomyces percursus]|uniref:Zinc finger double-stranded RNA binding domain-containing protein n=1 Tax=Blastomyces percursus TaxID=1658174 RepID=A0A1J9RH00_9EURO|nr:hypothetical protein ACJ73_01337 [Blastomyces percursus]
MPPRKDPKAFLQGAHAKGSGRSRHGINGNRVTGTLSDRTKVNYRKAYELFEALCELRGKKDPVKWAYDMETLKDFVHEVTWGIDGHYGEEAPSENSVKIVWKNFTAYVRQHHGAIPLDITGSVTNYLEQEALPERGAKPYKRKRKYATKHHCVHLGRQLWEADWHEYKTPGRRVRLWGQTLGYAFSSSRQGEILESSARPDSGRGVYCKNINFGIFRNELGEAEIGLLFKVDAKGMTRTPQKHPEHLLYEGFRARPLLLNPILPLLAMCLAWGLFRDYITDNEILDIQAPPEGEVYLIEWSAPNAPLYKGWNGEMQTASSFDSDRRALGKRAGYIDPPTVHDYRAEGLVQIDRNYSETQRKKHAGHRSSRTHHDYYAPNNDTDGQAAYLGDPVRTHVVDVFRNLKLERNPDLWQSLPAEKQYALKKTEGYLTIEKRLQNLGTSKAAGKERNKERNALYGERRRLIDKELRKCQKEQHRQPPSKDALDSTYYMGHYRARFARASRMMPERQRLAINIFEVATLRSKVGREVLRDMIALCSQKHEIETRLGLEPNKCHCGHLHSLEVDDSANQRPSRCVYPAILTVCLTELTGWVLRPASYEWMHIYICHKRHLVELQVFAEFCFLCDKWFTNMRDWEEHCKSHLHGSLEVPVQCDPLIYGGTLVAPGLCPGCIGDETLPATEQMKQYTRHDLWKDHVSSCFKQRVVKGQHGPDDIVGCTHPDTRCKQLSVSLLQLRFHFQDVHCTEVDTEVDHVRDSRGTKGVKRPLPRTDCKESEGNHTTKRSRRSLHAPDLMAKPLPEKQYVFINEIERMKSGLQGQVMQLDKL